jgi:outer membrane protein TolC
VISADAVAGYERTSQPAAGFSVGSPPAGLTVPPGTVTAEGRQVMPTATVKWLLFDFGGRAAVIEEAKQATVAADVSFNGSHQKLIWEVARAFHRHTFARARLAIARRTLANTQVLTEAAKARFARGVGTSIEVAQARQQVAQAELGLTRATGGVTDVHRGLLEAMGVAPTLEIAVEDVSARPLPKAPSVDLDRLVETALRRRPDVQAAFARLKADKAGIDRAKSEFLPKISLIGNVGRDYGTYTLSDSRLSVAARHSTGGTDAGLLLGMKIPIYDGGLRDAQVKAAESRAAAAADDLAKLQNEGAREIVVAYDTLRTSLAAHAAASELVAAATITADGARAAYRNGLGSLSDAITAETGLLQARLAKAEAHADALVAATTIAFATGDLTNRAAPPR